MRRPWRFPPGGFPAAVASRLSLWRVVHLRRLDLTLAIYGTLSLGEKQRLWPQARNALSEGPRKRIGTLEKFNYSLSNLMSQLLNLRSFCQGALLNDLF